ncbi:MAG: protein-disulfide reductase DsbD domain-containing protein [Phycisphaerales bacterium]
MNETSSIEISVDAGEASAATGRPFGRLLAVLAVAGAATLGAAASAQSSSPPSRFGSPGGVPQLIIPGFEGPERPSEIGEIAILRAEADVELVVPGRTFHLVMHVVLARDWHTYWEFAGASGAPMDIDLKLPGGFLAGPPRYMRPKSFKGPEGVTYGYERETRIFVPITAPKTLDPNVPVSITADVTYLACRDVCLFGNRTLTLELPAADSAGASPGKPSLAVARDYAHVPLPISAIPGATAKIEVEGDRRTLVMTMPHSGVADAAWFPSVRPGLTYGKPLITRDASNFTVRVPFTAKSGNALGRPMVVRGVLGLGTDPAGPAWTIDIPVDETGAARRTASAARP